MLPHKFDGQLDRLSCLISRFRVEAEVVLPSEIDGQAVNFSVFETSENQLDLVFCPHSHALDEVQSDCCHDVDGEIVVAARIAISGVGKHLIRALPKFIHVSLSDVPALASIIGPAVEEIRHPRCGGQAVLVRLLEVFVIRLLRYVVERQDSPVGLLAGLAHPRLSLALVSIHDVPDRQWSLQDLAEIAGMSRTQFAVTFREVIGSTPGNYITNWRLEVAREELAAGVPVKTVAQMCGFSSAAAFSRAFSRRYGHAPKYARRP